MLELYPNAAFDIWDRFDHLFINKLFKETGRLKEEINKPLNTDKNVKKESVVSLKEVSVDPDNLKKIKEKYNLK